MILPTSSNDTIPRTATSARRLGTPKKCPEGRWRKFGYDELTARDKTSLDVFCLEDKSLTDLDSLPEPDELAKEIIENLDAGLESFRKVLADLGKVA
jgi:type I restriction enzyme M protein